MCHMCVHTVYIVYIYIYDIYIYMCWIIRRLQPPIWVTSTLFQGYEHVVSGIRFLDYRPERAPQKTKGLTCSPDLGRRPCDLEAQLPV